MTVRTIRDLEAEQCQERKQFRADCPHKAVRIERGTTGHYTYEIVLRCVVCEEPIVVWQGAEKPEYSLPSLGRVLLAKGFVKAATQLPCEEGYDTSTKAGD